jgi:hypothetical protein
MAVANDLYHIMTVGIKLIIETRLAENEISRIPADEKQYLEKYG